MPGHVPMPLRVPVPAVHRSVHVPLPVLMLVPVLVHVSVPRNMPLLVLVPVRVSLPVPWHVPVYACACVCDFASKPLPVTTLKAVTLLLHLFLFLRTDK